MDHEAWIFKQSPKEGARDLLGRLIIRRTGSGMYAAEIVETGAYAGGEMTDARIGMTYDAGRIFLMPHRGHYMLNIACGESGPACIEIREIYDQKKIEGSAKIANYLQLPPTLDGKFLGEESGLFISDEKFRKGKVIKESGVAGNCVGIYRFG